MRADSSPPLRTRAVFLRAFCAALLLAVGGNASSLAGKRFVGRYDFGYAVQGDRLARPAQVFDDGGGKIYFEARPHQPMPAVFAGRDLALLVLQPEGQYFSARTSATEFTLVLGAARATVRRGDAVLGEETITPQDGAARLASAGSGLTSGIEYDPPADPALRRVRHEQPIVFAPRSATLRPEVLEALSVLVLRIGPDTAISAVGRNDAGGHDALAVSRAEALRNALLARGIAARDIRIVADDDDGARPHPNASSLRWTSTEQTRDAAASSASPAPSFDITAADGDIAVSLRRWAQSSGYQIAWDVDWVAPVNGALRLQAPSFVDAVHQVVAGLRAQGYPVQARIDADRVVRFVAAE
ncbi:MAG: TcpQ domain-containing protein [Burkholderiales bacterium]|nr:TcpQ domain-containing protein [Burkholderiales bacterium]